MDENRNESEQGKTHGFRVTRKIELHFWRDCLLNAAGLLLAWLMTDKIVFSDVPSFIALVMLIWFLNWILRPILVLFTLPFIILTMGVGMIFINAFIIYFAARLIPGDGITVGSFWAAMLAAFLISAMSWGISMARSEKIIMRALRKNGNGRDDDKNNKNNDIIDV